MRFMKKAMLFVLAGVLAGSLAGCGAKEETVNTYTSKSGNFSIDLPGKAYEEKNEGDNVLSLNNGTYAFGILQFPKHEMEEKDIYTFDSFGSEMKTQLLKAFSLTEVPEVAVTVPNMTNAKGWMFDLKDSTKTQAIIILGETEDAYYQYTAESLPRKYNEEKFISIFGTLKELNVPAGPDETMNTFTSESGKFTIEVPGEWDESDTGMGMMLVRKNVALKVELLPRDQAEGAGITNLDEFVEMISSSDAMMNFKARAEEEEVTFDPGKYKGVKAFVYDTSASDQVKQVFIYLESDGGYISFNIGSSLAGYDTMVERYYPVIQSLTEQ